VRESDHDDHDIYENYLKSIAEGMQKSRTGHQVPNKAEPYPRQTHIQYLIWIKFERIRVVKVVQRPTTMVG